VRVCIVGESHPLAYMGGAEYQTGLLADILAHRGDVSLTYLSRRVPTPAQAANLPYAVRSIGSDAGFRRRAVLFDAPALRRALREIRPDVIYQQAKQSYTGVCARYARREHIPFFYQVASDADLDNRWISLHWSLNTPLDVAESTIGDWGIRHASHVIVQTQQQAESLRRNFGREPAALVRNFQPIPDSLPEKQKAPVTVLWVGNFKDVKQPQLFVDLAESLRSHPDLRFVMVGRPSPLRRFASLMQRIPWVASPWRESTS
jgi:glycosyltransferase involved in cell wall biosynthesis